MANSTNPASGAANASVPALRDVPSQSTGKTVADIEAGLLDENFIKFVLSRMGKPETPELIATMRNGMKHRIAQDEASYNKEVKKELDKAEKEGKTLDGKAIGEKCANRVFGIKRTMIREELGLTGSCSNCEIQAVKLGFEQNKTLQKCARCKGAMYCSRECQKAHWPTHKPVCKLPSDNKS